MSMPALELSRQERAREAIHHATALHCSQRGGLDVVRLGCRVDRSSYGSSTDIVARHIWAGKVLSVIDQQTPKVRDWLLYAYAAEQSLARRSFVQHSLFASHYNTLRAAPGETPAQAAYRDRKRLRLLALCAVAVDDYRSRVNNGRTAPIEAMAETLNEASHGRPMVTAGNWHRDGWRDELRALQADLSRFDSIGLDAVGAII